jgi:hypothetical protein
VARKRLVDLVYVVVAEDHDAAEFLADAVLTRSLQNELLANRKYVPG